MQKSHIKLSTTHLILLSFFAAILLGSILLALPISSATGKAVPYIDALFTATTATCVTGLVTVTTATAWSLFGHIVILVLIQIGGLGIITIMTGIMIMFQKKIGLGDRILIQDAFNLNTLSGLAKFVKNVILGTFLVEGIGAVLYMFVFVPQFGLKGIWYSVFNSISAFCNAGIDIIADNSLCDYVTHPLVNFVTCSLIIVSGIGYIVWWDILRVWKDKSHRRYRRFKNLTLHSKIAITTTLILLLGGTLLIFIFEYNNPLTMKDFTWFDKLQASFFQAVTTRTAGFITLPQENLSNASSIVSLLLMFIGGSPVGTAGGVKTVTIAVLVASAIASVKNKDEVILFNRNLAKSAVVKAIAVVVTSFTILFVSTILLAAVTPNASALDIAYETVSATATVGLSRNLTTSLTTIGKSIVIATMYLGRVGPISLAIAFKTRKVNEYIITNPTEDINVG